MTPVHIIIVIIKAKLSLAVLKLIVSRSKTCKTLGFSLIPKGHDPKFMTQIKIQFLGIFYTLRFATVVLATIFSAELLKV